MDKVKFNQKVIKGFEQMGIRYNNKILDYFQTYLLFLLEENEKYNLTAIKEPSQVIIKHFYDSLAIWGEIELAQGKLIDVGTGAGFPGLVLKIISPQLNTVLLDSLAKRINFLNQLIKKLDLPGIIAIHERAETLGNDQLHRESYDWVVSRAVATVNVLSEYTLPLARVGGRIIFYKGPDVAAELKEGQVAIEELGGEITAVKALTVPELEGERYLVFIEKVKQTPFKYPRRSGIPKKRPL